MGERGTVVPLLTSASSGPMASLLALAACAFRHSQTIKMQRVLSITDDVGIVTQGLGGGGTICMARTSPLISPPSPLHNPLV